jgi:hypothetical protein
VTVVRNEVKPPKSVEADFTIAIYNFDISTVHIYVEIPGKAKAGDGKLVIRGASDDSNIAEYTISKLQCREDYLEDTDSTTFEFEIDNIKEYIEWYFAVEGNLFVSLEENTTIVYPSLTKDSKYMGMFDVLGFKNSSSFFNNEYYLDDADKLFLKNSVSEKEWNSIKKTIDNGWGGSCQGFAAIAYLNAKGVLLPEYIKENEKSLWNISDTTKRIQSIVNTYFMQQKKTSFEAAKAGWLMHNVTDIVEQLEKACSGISASNPLLICLGSSQHALLGYGLETGVYNDIGAEKNTYHNRILIYDCNYPAVMKYLYFDKKTDKWYYSDTQKQILMLTNKKDMIDPIDFSGHLSNPAQEVKAPNSPDVGINYITNAPSTGNIFNYNISVNGELISVKPGMILPDKGMATSFLMQSAYDEDGNELPPTEMTLYLPEDTHDYTIYPTADQSCDFSLMSNDAFTYIEADAAKEIRIEDDGFIEASGVEGAYKLSVTVDDITDSYPWHTTQACGTADGTVSMELTEEGVVIAGTDLSGVTVTVERDDVTDEIRFTASEDSVLIVPKKEGDMEEVKIMADTDGDGEYETELAAEPDVLPGDVNSDKNVNKLDLITLSRHFAGWDGYGAETLDMDAADVNGDGTVNAADRLFLARMLDRWTGYVADR